MPAPASPPPHTPTLHLLLPGLLWPARALQDMVFDLELPALAWLLGRGRRSQANATNALQWQAGILGLPQLPVAALRTRAAALEPGEWLCLDPIHLRVERTQLIVEDPAALQLSTAEAAALQADLAPLLAELGNLHCSQPHEWHLRLHAPSDIRTTPLPEAIGLNGDSLMPQAANVRVWRRVLNEVQMALHAHPVNQARSARGQPVVNSVWPWGEGAQPGASQHRWHSLQAAGSLWQGLAAELGSQWQPPPARYAPVTGNTLVLHSALDAPARQHDAVQWRNAMLALEENWFAPLRQALASGALRQLVLHGQGHGHSLTLTLTPRERLCFWRRPAPLAMLGVEDPA